MGGLETGEAQLAHSLIGTDVVDRLLVKMIFGSIVLLHHRCCGAAATAYV